MVTSTVASRGAHRPGRDITGIWALLLARGMAYARRRAAFAAAAFSAALTAAAAALAAATSPYCYMSALLV